MQFLAQVKAAVNAATPIIAITTMDQQATFRTISAAFPKRLIFIWDFLTGVSAIGPDSEKEKGRVIARMQTEASSLTVPKVMLEFASLLAERSMLFIFNAHNYLPGNPPRISDGTLSFVQGVWNCREPNKDKSRTLFLLGPDMPLPRELVVDVLQLDEPLPTAIELETSINEMIVNWNNSMGKADQIKLAKDDKMVRDTVDALRGIESRSASDQVVSMSLSNKGVDVLEVWSRKRTRVDQTPGMKWYTGLETLNSVCGYEVVSNWHMRMLQSERRPIRTIIIEDEFEKSWRTKGGGDSGVGDDMLGMKLTEMQENGYSGSIFVGGPGTGKSILVKCLGGEIAKPVIFLDMARMKEGLVGSSTKNQAQAYKIIKAISDGNAYFIATSNGLAGIPAELLRRYKGGIWMFDLPTQAERWQMWQLYLKKYEIPYKIAADGKSFLGQPDDDQWTGSEIQKCCEMAWLMGIPLLEAAKSVIPIATSNRKQLEDLRELAHGTYLSASYEGPYQKDRKEETVRPVRRQFSREDV